MKDKSIYIQDMLDAITRLESYTAGLSLDDFERNPMLQDAVAFNLEVIGEASRRLPEDVKISIDLPWSDISAIRNKISHDYFELDEEAVWLSATDDVKEMKEKLQSLI